MARWSWDALGHLVGTPPGFVGGVPFCTMEKITPIPPRIMKKSIRVAALVGVLFVVSACASSPVQDKRAPGIPGHKTFEIQVDDSYVPGSARVWIKVSEKEWDKCHVGDQFPSCKS